MQPYDYRTIPISLDDVPQLSAVPETPGYKVFCLLAEAAGWTTQTVEKQWPLLSAEIKADMELIGVLCPSMHLFVFPGLKKI